MKIGVIGLGMVGQTIFHVMKFFNSPVKGYDKYKPSDSFEEVLDMDIVFIAVPTNGKEGRLDCSIVRNVLEKLEKASYNGVVCIKSTVGINFLDDVKKFPLRIVYMPEFLHERNRLADFISPDHVVMSGEKEDLDILRQAFFWVDDSKFFFVDDRTAEVTKRVINAFAATKISFTNEIAMICHEVGANAEKVMEILRQNGRCAPEYTDPTKGAYGGMCLPKDMLELINFTNKSILLKAVEEVNENVKEDTKENSGH